MYSTCLFCHSGLRTNVAIERLPVGRRLAFDAAKGRLWVICLHCSRWNLTPLEERWEAIEECERAFRVAHVRAATDNISLAVDGRSVELVRIGTPPRPELEHWRYRVDVLERSGMSVAIAALRNIARRGRTFVRTEDGNVIGLDKYEVSGAQLVPESSRDGWRVEVRKGDRTIRLPGNTGLAALGPLLARLNLGALDWEIEEAINYLERAGGPAAHLERTSRTAPELSRLRPTILLSLEMAVAGHREDGTLHELEAEWRQAEEIAAIADNLLVPTIVTHWLDRHRQTDRRFE